MLALSGSVLMMMLVSALFSVPTPTGLQASMVPNKVFAETFKPAPISSVTSRKPEEILNIIQEYVAGNDPDAAKKLYDELYAVQNHNDITMGGEVEGK
ncbi:hypothetical protein KBB89_02920 [Candidatus Gracilibacteria bacterium]|nr:hypothetical protein [Candidatus Gracilibacteria bacterium]